MTRDEWKRIVNYLIDCHLPPHLIFLAIDKIKRGEVYESAWPEHPAFKRVAWEGGVDETKAAISDG